jgi:hypothetical protein
MASMLQRGTSLLMLLPETTLKSVGTHLTLQFLSTTSPLLHRLQDPQFHP